MQRSRQVSRVPGPFRRRRVPSATIPSERRPLIREGTRGRPAPAPRRHEDAKKPAATRIGFTVPPRWRVHGRDVTSSRRSQACSRSLDLCAREGIHRRILTRATAVPRGMIADHRSASGRELRVPACAVGGSWAMRLVDDDGARMRWMRRDGDHRHPRCMDLPATLTPADGFTRSRRTPIVPCWCSG